MTKGYTVGLTILFILSSLFMGLDRFFHHYSSHFAFSKVTSSSPLSSEWNLPRLSDTEQAELDQILKQKFTFFSKGSQAYVFISEDGQYILKFLKMHKLTPKSWLAFFPFSFNPYYQQALFKAKKLKETFNACKTAYIELKNETGLIYVHLAPTHHLNQTVALIDKNQSRHFINLDETCFYVQKRAQLIYPRISELMHAGDMEGARNIITSVFSLIDFLGKKGVADNDPILRKNFGIIGDRAVQIDIGKMRIDPIRQQNLAYQQEVDSITHSFKLWLERNYPQLLPHFQEKLQATCGKPCAIAQSELAKSQDTVH